MDYLIDLFSRFVTWLHDFALWLPRQVYRLLLEGLASVINAIPVPAFLTDASANLSAIPSGVAYFGAAFRIGEGITIIVGAYLLRFLIRRIPFIG